MRTEYGISKLIEIRKVDGCEEQKIYIFDDISDELWSGDLPNELWKSEIEWHEEKFNNKIFLKHSKQLIDLIEVGDVLEIRTGLYSSFKYFVENEDNLLLLEEQVKQFWNIETILTKEQFEANCYKVGGKDE